jgi:MYXO-CTERM domain-containing protein
VNPDKPDGTPCDDNDACTQTDTCQAGACQGGGAVVCPPPDGCHDPGVCDTTTGVCTNPAKADGSPCNQGGPCTESDSCQAGVCVEGIPVTCNAIDECHDPGTCDASTGACSTPAKPDGTPCSGGGTCEGGVCTTATGSGGSGGGTGGGGGGGGGGGNGGDAGSGGNAAGGNGSGGDPTGAGGATVGGGGGSSSSGLGNTVAGGGCGCRSVGEPAGRRTALLVGVVLMGAVLARRRRPSASVVR